jgi:hypothetical protein
MDAPIYSAASQQRIVGGIDYGINLLQSNVAFDHQYPFWHFDHNPECNTKIKD